ncbi:hypothetical protein ACH4E7_23475 [Kitasatospora sp. NPDC018058]|uniref:hypothetical protein n=1 Tax=Kitasatospora sp. NPDC018058 TaxID=3364025 RepID=UPI0037C02E4F
MPVVEDRAKAHVQSCHLLAAAVEGAPPPLEGPTPLAFGNVTLVATALAFACRFAGLRHLPAATVGLLGLLNPLAGAAGHRAGRGRLRGAPGGGAGAGGGRVLLGRPRPPRPLAARAAAGRPGLPRRRVP